MIAVRETGGAVVVEVDGDFAERVAEEFNAVAAALLDRGSVRVVLNLRRAQWTSLKALKWLAGCARKFRARDGDLKLAGANPYLNSLLELTGTLTLFDTYPTVEDAVASFSPAASVAH
jgi:anti-anti-sigma factor